MPNSAGVVQSNSMNKTAGRHIHNYSTFTDSLSYRLANTLRFGDYTPSFFMEGVENDSISLNSKDVIDSLSLNAPFKGSIRKIKESFKVPNMAILPLNWDTIYTQPSNGDDVPVDSNCVLLDFPKNFSDFWESLVSLLRSNLPTNSSTDADVALFLTGLLRVLVLGEYVYSTGSLLNVSGYKGSAQFFSSMTANGLYDELFDQVVMTVFGQFKSLPVAVYNDPSAISYIHMFEGLASGSSYNHAAISSFRSLLELFRQNPSCAFDVSDATLILEYKTNLADFVTAITPLFASGMGLLGSGTYRFILPNAVNTFDTTTDPTSLNPNSLNLSRLFAYQLVCAHYYSNSSVDAVYSAELYRQNLVNLYRIANAPAGFPQEVTVPSFTWNGLERTFDYLSGRVVARQLYLTLSNTLYSFSYSSLTNTIVSNPRAIARFVSFAEIFAFRKSLRYGDYFVGSRPRPLAPINTDVAVSGSNTVSVIDITRNIQAQRFANSVMRSRQKIEEYVKSLFGKAPAPDYHNPFFLSREAEIIYGDEVQNTADAQATVANSRTSNFSSPMNRFTFTFNNDDEHPCIYLQIISFDVKRFYTKSVERQFLHLDRYDMFNPDFQYIGDQPIYGIELGYPEDGPFGTGKFADNFAYTTRDMEYKQRYDQACGGFVCSLPGWILTDSDRSRVPASHLDPDFIRSYNTELDQFYLSLTGFSLGTYFHFVCITNNLVDAKRAMAVDPQILA